MTLLTIPAIAFSMLAAPAGFQSAAQTEQVDLTRVFAKGDVDRFKVHVTIDENGQAVEANAEVIATVMRSLDKGMTEISRKMEKLEFTVNGSKQDMPGPNERLDNFDKYGLPESMEVDGPEVVYVIQAFSGYSPAAKVAVGGNYEIKWKTHDDSVKIEGKGTLTEIVEIDGAKYAKCTSKATVSPSDDTPGEVTWTSWLGIKDGKLFKADGKVAIGETALAFKVERIIKK